MHNHLSKMKISQGIGRKVIEPFIFSLLENTVKQTQ